MKETDLPNDPKQGQAPTLSDGLDEKLEYLANGFYERSLAWTGLTREFGLSEHRAAALVAVEHERGRVEAELGGLRPNALPPVASLRAAYRANNDVAFDDAIVVLLQAQVDELNKASEAYRSLQAELIDLKNRMLGHSNCAQLGCCHEEVAKLQSEFAALRVPAEAVTVEEAVAVVSAWEEQGACDEDTHAVQGEIDKLIAPRMAKVRAEEKGIADTRVKRAVAAEREKWRDAYAAVENVVREERERHAAELAASDQRWQQRLKEMQAQHDIDLAEIRNKWHGMNRELNEAAVKDKQAHALDMAVHQANLASYKARESERTAKAVAGAYEYCQMIALSWKNWGDIAEAIAKEIGLRIANPRGGDPRPRPLVMEVTL